MREDKTIIPESINDETKEKRPTRAHGTGSITELIPNKKYRVRVTRGTRLDGKPRAVCETINGTRQQAEARAIVLYDEMGEDPARGAGLTLAMYYEQVFLPRQRTQGRTRANLNAYATAWNHTPDEWKRAEIREPSYTEIQDHIDGHFTERDENGRPTGKYNAGAAKSWAKYFKAILRAAWKDGILKTQPMKAAHTYAQEKKGEATRAIWDETETAAAWLLLRGHRLEAYTLIGAGAGTRREETIALTWEDIEFITERGGNVTAYITIDKAITEEDGAKGTKNSHSARVIPLTGYAARRLYEIRGTGAICKTKTGAPLGISGLRRQWARLWEPPRAVRYSRSDKTRERAAGALYGRITPITLNALRHSSISMFSEAGVTDSANMRYHGHAPRTVQTRHYMKRYDRALVAAAEKAAQLIEDAAGFAVRHIVLNE